MQDVIDALPLWVGAAAFALGSLCDVLSSLRFQPEITEKNPLWRSGRFFRVWRNVFASVMLLMICLSLPLMGVEPGGVAPGLIIGGAVRLLAAVMNVRLRFRIKRARRAFQRTFQQVPASTFTDGAPRRQKAPDGG